VAHSKPDPETFLKAARLLEVPPAECLVFEDAPKGVEAAANAGMPAVVLTTMHRKEDFAPYNNIVAFVKDYTDRCCNPFAGNTVQLHKLTFYIQYKKLTYHRGKRQCALWTTVRNERDGFSFLFRFAINNIGA
jgi:hypothetical protein